MPTIFYSTFWALWRLQNASSEKRSSGFRSFIQANRDSRKSMIQQCFHLTHEASWVCKTCNKSHAMSDPPGFSISLAIFPHGKAPSLRSCMDRYHVEKNLEIRCDGCKSNTFRDRVKRILSPPEVFIVHLARFGVSITGKTYKSSERVELPELFDLAPWTKSGQKRTAYRLQAAVYHAGSLSNGHYIARVRGSDGIVLLDDEARPRPVHAWWSDMGSFTPYILLYSRI